MKKSFKIIIFAFLFMALFAPHATFAAEVSIQSTSLPTSTWNLSTKGSYTFAGEANIQDLYSNYLFTGVTKVSIGCQNKRTDRVLTVKLVRDDPAFDTVVSSVSIPKGGYLAWPVTGLSSPSKYYLRFYAPCYFTGSISKAN